MVDITIRGGLGQGRAAGVSLNNRLLVDSVTHPAEYAATISGRSFITNTSATANTLTVTATGGYIMTIENTSATRTLIINKILISCDAAAAVIVFERNPTLGSLGNNTAVTPVNQNFASGITAEATVNIWDEVGNGITGVTAGDVLATHVQPASIVALPVDGAWQLGTNDTFAIKANSTSTTDEMSFLVRFNYINSDTLTFFEVD